MSNFLAATAEGGAMGWGFWIIYIVIILGAMYFIAIRPQRKQQKKQNELQNSLSMGDSVLTSGGFYGVIIDITEDTVIVELSLIHISMRSVKRTFLRSWRSMTGLPGNT